MSLTNSQANRTAIANSLARFGFSGSVDVDANIVAFIAFRMISAGIDRANVTHEEYVSTINDHQLDPILQSYLSEERDTPFEDAAISLCKSTFTNDELRDFVLHNDPDENRFSPFRGEWTTPRSIRELALGILNCSDNETLYDECCGVGSFLVDAIERNPSIKTCGTELNQTAACLSIARMNLLPGDRPIMVNDVFHNPRLGAYDKVFANPPFVMSLTHMSSQGAEYLEPFMDGSDPMGRPASSDWVFARLAYDLLAEGGTAACVVTNGALFNGGDKRARRYFVENGMLKAVVVLPAKLFRSTAIGCGLLVLGHNDGPIRMVDASDLADEGRRWNTLSSEAVKEILNRLAMDGSTSRLVERKDIAARDYSLYASRYLNQAPDLVNPMPLGKLALDIERGAGFRAKELDSLTTEEDTGLCYLWLSKIEDGMISNDLPYLSSLDKKTKKQWLHTGDLVISKNGSPFKIAVAEVPEGKTILANGNLYVVRLDSKVVDPYFVAAFLASEDGKRSLEQMVVGTTIPNLPLANLKQIMIPVPPLDVQHKVATEYRSKLDEISVLKIRVGKAREAAASAYDEAMNR